MNSWGALLYMVIMLCSGFSRFVQNVTFTHFNRYAFLFILSYPFSHFFTLVNPFAGSRLPFCSSMRILLWSPSPLAQRWFSRRSLCPWFFKRKLDILSSLAKRLLYYTYAFYLAVTNLCIATFLYNAAPAIPLTVKAKSVSVPYSIEFE